MGEVKQNSPQVLRDSGKQLIDLGDEAASAWERLKSTSEGMGDIFGDDMVGGLIGAAYAAIFELANETFTSASEDFAAIGERLVAIGDADEETETANSEALRKLQDKLDQIGGGR